MNERTSAIGHEFQVNQLWHLTEIGRIPQALLLSGPQAIGKRRIALDLAAEFLAYGSGRPAEAERKLIWSGNHPDMHILHREEDKRELTVDRMREFCSSMRLVPYQGKTSVWIIDNAEEMNVAASNSLLMPLEEPPAHAKIILTTSEIHRIVPTIVSRCQPVFFGYLSQHELGSVLTSLCSTAGEEVDKKLVAELTALGGGSLAELALDPFLDPATGAVKDGEAMIEHLRKIVAVTRAVRSKVESALRSGTPTAHLTSVAAELAAEKDGSNLTWSVLRRYARSRLNSGSPKQIAAWAAALESTVRSERLVHERNLSAQLHLTDLLLQFGDAESAS